MDGDEYSCDCWQIEQKEKLLVTAFGVVFWNSPWTLRGSGVIILCECSTPVHKINHMNRSRRMTARDFFCLVSIMA